MNTWPNDGLGRKLFTGIGIAALLVIALTIGGWFLNTAFAQGPWQGDNWSIMHNNQAVLDLLKTNENDLLKERQAGKSWLDIATAKGVSEQALTDALLQPMTQMQSWMTQNYPQTNVAQMTEWMREQFAQDLRVTQYGTMTDMHVFSGSMMNGMMNGNNMMGNGMMNGNGMMGGGMMNGNGMMGNGNDNNGFGGMMGGGMMNGGMMGGMMNGSFNTPNVNVTPVPSTQKIDREVNLTVSTFKFAPVTVTVKQGETVKFTITNQDKSAQIHFNFARTQNLNGRGGAFDAAQHRAHARHDFARAERLCDIVVRAEFETNEPVGFFHARREHDDRRIRFFANRAQHVKSI